MDTALNTDPALEVPLLNHSPLPAYGYDRLDYGMTIGLERTGGGRLWACWVGGGDNEKAFFVLARSEDRGRNWSDPILVIDPHRSELPSARRALVGTLWLDPSNCLWLFFDQALAQFDGRAGTWVTRCDNPDADRPTWTTPQRIWHGSVLNKPLIHSDGTWFLVISLWDRGKISKGFERAFPELDPFRMANVFASTDAGGSWERRGGVLFPNPEFDEAHLIEKQDGSLWMTGRTHLGLWESFSKDGGVSWTEPEKALIANANSRHHLRRLASGNLLLIKHGTQIETSPGKIPYDAESRSQLTAFLSKDDGRTWSGGLLLDERKNVSYPDGTQLEDGTLCVSYDHDRDTLGEILLAKFREEDVLAGHLISADASLRQLISRPDPAAVAKRHAG